MSQLSVLGEIRPRTEYRHGYKTLVSEEDDPAFFISQRTRLKLSYVGQKMRVGIAFQDIRTWGNTSQLKLSDNWSSIHEAWAEILFSEIVSLKLGRQEVVLDNHRIMGNVDWAQQARSHDIAILKITPDDRFTLQVGLAYNQDQERVSGNFYSVSNNYKTLQYIWLNNKWKQTNVSFLFLNNGIQVVGSPRSPKTLYNQTIGGYLSTNLGDFSLEGSAYYQFGKDTSENRLSAYQLMGNLQYMHGTAYPVPFFGVEILSGTNEEDMLNQDFNKNHSFSPLFGTNHKFNGHMDYFYVANHLNNVGLIDFYLGGDWKRNKLNIMLTMHQFFSHAFLMDPFSTGNNLKRTLGTEIDITSGYKITENLIFRIGYSQMFATESMEVLKGGDRNITQNWIWCMVSFTPAFFNNEN
jgi:hypothetical protein